MGLWTKSNKINIGGPVIAEPFFYPFFFEGVTHRVVVSEGGRRCLPLLVPMDAASTRQIHAEQRDGCCLHTDVRSSPSPHNLNLWCSASSQQLWRHTSCKLDRVPDCEIFTPCRLSWPSQPQTPQTIRLHSNSSLLNLLSAFLFGNSLRHLNTLYSYR